MAHDRTLLLIEDDDTTREVLTVLLEADGWKTQAAPTGEDALRLLQTSEVPPSVILTDQQLPGIAGQALANSLRDILRTRDAHAILLGMSASVKEAPGFDAILHKPFQAAEVLALCDRIRSTDTANPFRQKTQPLYADAPVLDDAIFVKLEEQMGKRVQDLYSFALADANDRLRHMDQALGAEDADLFRKEAHALKGSSGMIGARRLSTLAAEAEKTATFTAPMSAARELITQMHNACNELRLMLETLFPL